jgi:hypothetical protein
MKAKSLPELVRLADKVFAVADSIGFHDQAQALSS